MMRRRSSTSTHAAPPLRQCFLGRAPAAGANAKGAARWSSLPSVLASGGALIESTPDALNVDSLLHHLRAEPLPEGVNVAAPAKAVAGVPVLLLVGEVARARAGAAVAGLLLTSSMEATCAGACVELPLLALDAMTACHQRERNQCHRSFNGRWLPCASDTGEGKYLEQRDSAVGDTARWTMCSDAFRWPLQQWHSTRASAQEVTLPSSWRCCCRTLP